MQVNVWSPRLPSLGDDEFMIVSRQVPYPVNDSS